MFLAFFGFKLMLAEDSVRNRASKKVANLGVQGKLNLKTQKPQIPEINGDRSYEADGVPIIVAALVVDL